VFEEQANCATGAIYSVAVHRERIGRIAGTMRFPKRRAHNHGTLCLIEMN